MLTAGITTQASVSRSLFAANAVTGTPSAGTAASREGGRAAYPGRIPLLADTVGGSGEEEPTAASSRNPAENGRGTGRPAASTAAHNVDFVYDIKGNVKIKFMDSRNNLIYQMPPEHYYRMSSRTGEGRGRVNTRV